MGQSEDWISKAGGWRGEGKVTKGGKVSKGEVGVVTKAKVPLGVGYCRHHLAAVWG